MTAARPGVLFVDSVYGRGGAAAVTAGLVEGVRRRGMDAWHLVGHAEAAPPEVLRMPPRRSRRAHGLALAARALRRALPTSAEALARTAARIEFGAPPADGRENFEFPGTHRLLSVPPRRPDLVHCHNLHGGYFDLRVLPRLSRQVPVLITMHDAWLLSGHCAHSFDCERWQTGCGMCPDLSIPPAIPADRTAENWRLKARIHSRSRLRIATPSGWLMQKVERSMLMPAVVERRVIPNGVDLATFAARPGREAERARLGLAADEFVVLFVANGIRGNVWKDVATLRASLARLHVSLVPRRRVRMLAVGEDAPPERIGEALIEFVPHVDDAARLASYYRAADAYAHAARADTFPNTVLEALAAGTPVVATAVGGIPEQVRALDHPAAPDGILREPAGGATGLLVAPGDAEGMAQCLALLATDAGLRTALGRNASVDAARRFDRETTVDRYAEWYRRILAEPA